MAGCEANYARLLKLFPALTVEPERQIGLKHGEYVVVLLSVLEQTPYTTLVNLQQHSKALAQKRWLDLPELRVRLYHDAKVAEVVDCEGLRRPEPRCQYPNAQMHQRDEKAQWNRFLGEWLAQCIDHGYCVETQYEPIID